MSSIQDRTPEFRSILAQAQKTLARQRKGGPQAQPLVASNGAATPPTRKQRSEFARNAAAIGRGISATMGKLQRLGELAKRKTLFDDRPVEIAELTYVIKQDLAGLNQQIGNLQTIQRGGAPGGPSKAAVGQEGEHNKNVVMLLQGKLADVGVNFKEHPGLALAAGQLRLVCVAAIWPAITLGTRRQPLRQSAISTAFKKPHSRRYCSGGESTTRRPLARPVIFVTLIQQRPAIATTTADYGRRQ
jgi:hypothetical protein